MVAGGAGAEGMEWTDEGVRGVTGVELRLCCCWAPVVGDTALRRLEHESFLLSSEAMEAMELSRPEEEYRRMS